MHMQVCPLFILSGITKETNKFSIMAHDQALFVHLVSVVASVLINLEVTHIIIHYVSFIICEMTPVLICNVSLFSANQRLAQLRCVHTPHENYTRNHSQRHT